MNIDVGFHPLPASPLKGEETREASMLNWLCGELGVDKAEVLSSRRGEELVAKRRVMAYAMRCYGLSYPEVGKIMNLHHTTVMRLCRNANLAEGMKAEALAERWDFINAA